MEVGLPLRVADVVVVSVLLCDDDGDGDTNVDVDAVVVEVDEATAVSDVDGVVVVATVVVGVIDLDGDAVDDDVAVEVVLTVRDVVDVPLSEGENELVPVVEIDALEVEADEAVWDIDEDTDDDMDDERLIEALDVGLPLRVADVVVVSVLLCDVDVAFNIADDDAVADSEGVTLERGVLFVVHEPEGVTDALVVSDALWDAVPMRVVDGVDVWEADGVDDNVTDGVPVRLLDPVSVCELDAVLLEEGV